MPELNWKRKEYATWDEAFRGLAPEVRQECIRVADYTRVLFVAACAKSFGEGEAAAERMRGQYADLAYKCGLYHQLGKALVPHEYQILQSDFTEEEWAVYQKYIKDGAALIANLQVSALGERERRKAAKTGYATKNIPWLMIRESCQQHMERWNGSGYPEGLAGAAISVMGQLVGLAKELDRLSAQTKSETPFEEACAALRAQSGTLWSPELIAVLQAAEEPCREVYEKYINYTMTLPQTIPLVEKRPERPFGLRFRPMTDGKDGPPVGCEAIPFFSAVQNAAGEPATAQEQADMLRRTGLVSEVTLYFLYEAADALLRLQNCKLETRGVVVEVLPDFYLQGSQLQNLNKLFQDQPVPREKLLLTIPEETVRKAGKTTAETITRYLRNGVQLLLDGYRPDRLPAERLRELGFTWVRVAPELYLSEETAKAMSALKQEGFQLVGGGADTHDLLAWQLAAGVSFAGGTITGALCAEDELIRYGLMKERQINGA